MTLTAKDLMRDAVKIVGPDTPVSELDRAFIEAGVGSFPVVDADGELLGVVSRSDVVRQLSVEQSLAEMVVDARRDVNAFADDAEAARWEIGALLGQHIEGLRVADLMSRKVVSVPSDMPLQDLARLFVERGLHRVPVVDGGRLVGVISTLDLVAQLAGLRPWRGRAGRSL